MDSKRPVVLGLIVAAALQLGAPCWAQELQWQSELADGSQSMSHLLTAISGKPNSHKTDELLVGVKSIIREQANFRLVRTDGAELLVPRESNMGDRMFSCMEKIERQAREHVGDGLAEYVHNVDSLTLDGDSVLLHHSGQENIDVPLPTDQPWLPVRLKSLRLSNIHLQLVEGEGKEVHRLKKIDGIVAVVHSAGLDLNIEPREFWRYKDKKGHTHLVLGFENLVPKPVRSLLHLPDVVHVHWKVHKQQKKVEST